MICQKNIYQCLPLRDDTELKCRFDGKWKYEMIHLMILENKSENSPYISIIHGSCEFEKTQMTDFLIYKFHSSVVYIKPMIHGPIMSYTISLDDV